MTRTQTTSVTRNTYRDIDRARERRASRARKTQTRRELDLDRLGLPAVIPIERHALCAGARERSRAMRGGAREVMSLDVLRTYAVIHRVRHDDRRARSYVVGYRKPRRDGRRDAREQWLPKETQTHT